MKQPKNNLELIEVTESDVIATAKFLSNKSSMGPDGLSLIIDWDGVRTESGPKKSGFSKQI